MFEITGEPLDLDGSDPRALALRWYLAHARAGFRSVSEDDVRARHASEHPVSSAQRIDLLRAATERLVGLSLDATFAVSPHQGVARLRDPGGRGWRLFVILQPGERGLVRWGFIVREPPPAVAIRLARPSDGAALADLERRAPVVDGALRRVYDRGHDYLTATRVADEHHTLVAEVEGVLRGMVGQVFHPARADGRSVRLSYARHLRVDPAARGRGLFSLLEGAAAEHGMRSCDAQWTLTAVGNEAVERRVAQDVARSSAVRLRIDVRTVARPGALPAAWPADAASLAQFFDAASSDLELSRPWSRLELEARFAGAGARYGWDRLALGDGALLGVERGGVRVIAEGPGGREERRQAEACDVAALPGREAGLVPLVRAWCARLVDEGIDDLLVTVASPRLVAPLTTLAASETRFHLSHAFRVAPDADARGYFVDGMFF